MELEEALKITGFQKCEFEPDNDPCEKCDKPELQLYYKRTDYWENEGFCYCAACVIEYAKEISSITINECPECGSKDYGWPEDSGKKCFDCFSASEAATVDV